MRSLKSNIKLINFYPPYLFSGISLRSVAKDFTKISVQMKMRWYNRNLVGTHFGGSLYSMCDPFYMFILMEHLGKDYIVWDKAAAIRFRKPGLGTVHATFEISPAAIAEIKAKVDETGKGDFTFHTNVYNEHSDVVAEVEKVVYVRRKQKKAV
ncbi:MAG: YiiD C-terminal domain-containing protein [Chitinophagales bacterium]|nr:YiiD C-terminal domain-containing protein [Chitinophagales bacterium]